MAHYYQDTRKLKWTMSLKFTTEKAAIFVLPINVAKGKVGGHYIKGWDKNDEERLKNLEVEKLKQSAPEDILNDWEDLLDE